MLPGDKNNKENTNNQVDGKAAVENLGAERKEFDKMLKSIYVKQNYQTVGSATATNSNL